MGNRLENRGESTVAIAIIQQINCDHFQEGESHILSPFSLFLFDTSREQYNVMKI